MAITKIGTKLLANSAITTVKLGSSAVTRSDLQSGSIQPGHIDVNQGSRHHVDFIDGDFFIIGDKTKFDANNDPVAGAHIRSFSFAQLKTALSLSNAARGNEGSIQFNNGTGFDGIAKITTDGVHLTASNAGKVAFAYTDISGSTGEIFSDSKTGLTINAKTRLSLHSSGAVQGIQSGSLELRADGIFPSVKPSTSAVAGTYVINLTSGSTGANGNKTYGPVNNTSQLIQAVGTGSSDFMFFLSNGGSTALPSAQSVNFTGTAQEFRVEAVSGVSDWRDVAQNFFNKMKAQLETNTSIATVTFNAASSLNGTASITVAYDSIAGGVRVGTGRNEGGGSSTNSSVSAPTDESRFNADTSNSAGPPIQKGFSGMGSPDDQPAHEGGFVSTTTSGSAALSEVREWLNLGASGRTYNDVFLSALSASNTSSFHQATVDALTVGKFELATYSGGGLKGALSGSGTASIHAINVEEATFDGVTMTTARAAAAYMISGSGTASIHKLDADEGDFRKVIATVVSGATVQVHKADIDEGTHNRLIATVVTSSGTSTLAKLDADAGDFRKVIATNITSSGTSNLHVVTVDDVSGSSGKFYKLVVDDLSARKITSAVSTSEHFEVPQKQYIPFASGSSGASAEGAGLQIGGAAGSGSAGVASIVLGDAGSGAGKDLLIKIGAIQGASLSGSVSDGGQRFGVTGSISGSVGIFHSVSIATAMGNQDAIFSGSSFSAQTVSGALAQIFDLDVNKANIRDVDGTSATFTTVSGTTTSAHTLDADKVTANDVDGASATFTATISGSTVQVHALDADKVTAGDTDVLGVISGSGTSTLQKVTSDEFSGSHVQTHYLGSSANNVPSTGFAVKDLSIGVIKSNDVVKKSNLNVDIVRNNNNAQGGISWTNGQLSVGWKRRIFSRSTRKIVNRTQPTQGSGSLYTTCSLPTIQMVSGSESVYFNGLLLVKGKGETGGNPSNGDYNIDYNGGGGVTPGTYRMVFTSGAIGQESTGYKAKTYSPLKSGIAQLVGVQSTGSSGKEYYLFYLNEAADPSSLPISSSLNLEYSNLKPGAFRKVTAIEAISGVSDWRDIVSNLATAMNTELNTRADLATVTYNATSSINGTASIEITYKAGTIEGGIFIGDGSGHAGITAGQSLGWSPSTSAAIGNFGVGSSSSKIDGEPDTAGGFTQTIVSGSNPKAGTEIFLHPTLTMDSNDVLVVQYLSGSGASL